MPRAEITTKGLKRDLTKRKYKPWSSIAEYIWNGFDAGASVVNVRANYNELGGVRSISISDNGNGISNPKKFEPVFESEKKQDYESPRVSSIPHGKNGLGRFTFFTFAAEASWHTVYQKDDGHNYKYEVSINSDSLLEWNFKKDPVKTNEAVGTTVNFTLINSSFTDIEDLEILDCLKQEFAWFLELNKANNYKLNINDSPLKYSELIIDSEKLQSKMIGEHEFEFGFILWSCKLNEEYSRYYLVNAHSIEKFSKTTNLNNKGDEFFHSVYIKSSLFDEMVDLTIYGTNIGEANIFHHTKEGKAFNEMLKFLENYLHDKRRPFIKKLRVES